MESIIASQKVGKRRSSSGSKLRGASDRRAYASLFLTDAGGTPMRTMGEGAPRRRAPSRSGRGPGLGLPAWGASILKAPARLGGRLGTRLGVRLGGALDSLLGNGLRASFRPAQLSAPKDSKPRLVLAAACSLVILAAVGIACLVVGLSFPMPKGALLPEADPAPDALLEYLSPELADGDADSAPDVSTLPPAPVTLEMSSYTVRTKDSLASIARRFGLNMDTIISANGISSSQSVRSGAQLRIPNINGIIYKVRSGDSLASVARRYKIDKTAIVDANDLGTSRLTVGQSLFVPGARLPQETVTQAMGQLFMWPARGPITSPFGYRPDPFTGVKSFHTGIDIAVGQGTPIRAAMSGRVADVGYNANYGNYIIMSHADNFQTLYGHLSQILVSEGAIIAQGATIGLSGNTGYSTGPHLHFSIFRRSSLLNPLKYLK